MTDQEHFDYLLKKKHFDSQSFDDLSIDGICFSDCNLEMTSFHDASFRNCRFEKCDFYGAILNGVNFFDCNFIATDFSGASLEGALFTGTTLDACIFGLNAFGRGANITGTNFLDAIIKNCSFEKTRYSSKTVFPYGFDIARYDLWLKDN